MIRPVAETPETITLSRPDYEALLEALEDARDVAAATAAEARVASGESEHLPAEMVAALCAGEHPLRVWRTHRGLSARALAAAAGMAPSYLVEIEKGRKSGSVDVLKKLARALGKVQGGHGVLLGGVPGVDPGTVLIIGGGVVGINAAKKACGLGAKVYVLDINLDRLRYLSDVMPNNCHPVMSDPATIRKLIKEADVVVGCVLVPGSRTPKLVDRSMLKTMKKGAVLVDVSIDQGGCFETSEETNHSKPTYIIDGIVHYAVSNMPGAVPKTATLALNNATLPYAVEIANKGWKLAMQENPEIKSGANIVNGKITYKGVADAVGFEYTPIETLI